MTSLTRPTASGPPANANRPTFTPEQAADAQQNLCATYKLAAKEVQVETNGSDRALARIALTNAAAMIDNSASNPALDGKYRDAARALASAYRNTTALGSVATEAEYRSSLDAIVAKDTAMKQFCE
ncbi:hypothetical protein [Mycobacterium sp. 050134]|uniref:hypothetical protein n=1 Tax=Mycobacterium sp. 050134 TaxID=3096111 RepID=UPI002EDA5D15